MQSHRVLWNVSLSNGENFHEGSGSFEEIEGELSPWNKLQRYLNGMGALEITSLWLSCPSGARHVLPSRSNRNRHQPFLHAFHSAEKPHTLRCFRRLSQAVGDVDESKDLYTVAEASFENYKLQIFVSEHDPNVSWALVVPCLSDQKDRY